MQKFISHYARFVPALVPVLLVVVQALVDNGYLHLGGHSLALVDTLLVAFGFHALNVRTK